MQTHQGSWITYHFFFILARGTVSLDIFYIKFSQEKNTPFQKNIYSVDKFLTDSVQGTESQDDRAHFP